MWLKECCENYIAYKFHFFSSVYLVVVCKQEEIQMQNKKYKIYIYIEKDSWIQNPNRIKKLAKTQWKKKKKTRRGKFIKRGVAIRSSSNEAYKRLNKVIK